MMMLIIGNTPSTTTTATRTDDGDDDDDDVVQMTATLHVLTCMLADIHTYICGIVLFGGLLLVDEFLVAYLMA